MKTLTLIAALVLFNLADGPDIVRYFVTSACQQAQQAQPASLRRAALTPADTTAYPVARAQRVALPSLPADSPRPALVGGASIYKDWIYTVDPDQFGGQIYAMTPALGDRDNHLAVHFVDPQSCSYALTSSFPVDTDYPENSPVLTAAESKASAVLQIDAGTPYNVKLGAFGRGKRLWVVFANLPDAAMSALMRGTTLRVHVFVDGKGVGSSSYSLAGSLAAIKGADAVCRASPTHRHSVPESSSPETFTVIPEKTLPRDPTAPSTRSAGSSLLTF